MPVKSTSRLDPRRPLVLDVRELGRRPGSMRAVHRTVPAPDVLRVDLARVPAGEPLELDLRLESVVEGVLVSGTVAAPVTGECARCLGPVDDLAVVDVQELFAYEDSATEETTEEDEVSHLVGDLVDLEPVVRDAVVLALPLAPLCRDDCRGLCQDCGGVLDELPADHSHAAPVDPRWAALAERAGPITTVSTESQE
ncbi:MAG TPA: YceD family protein [Mycobacteriales bacterium]|nr:YceD family protein [Mycobacteriales bacterium]